jgi:succinate-semialdehyde dehydrogenase/glutarate-semialdehyde dehydrogenase
MTYEPLVSINPTTDKVSYRTAQLSDAALSTRMARAAKAAKEWREVSFADRAKKLRKAAQLLRQKKETLANLAAVEMGKTLKAGRTEVEKCALTLEFYAKEGHRMLAHELVATEASESYVQFDPIGVVLAVMPWNFPYWQVVRAAAPALMAGNTMLLKHASNVQRCALALEQVFIEAGFPQGCFQNLAIEVSRVEGVIRDPRVAAITLTGSETAGSKVARVAGEMLKKTVLELGGSDPFIVLKDADIDAACDAAVAARLQNNVGQSCISAKRFIVQKEVFDRFVAGVAQRIERLRIGDPRDEHTDVGPLASEQMFKTIAQQVAQSVQKGARVVLGGTRFGTTGCFYHPTVLTNVKKGMPAYDEELFGPVLAVIKAQDAKEAIRIANDTIYGLGATIFTKDKTIAKKMADSIDSGAVFINSMVKSDPRLPFGGVKKSGYGRELSAYGIKEFVNVKTVYVK